MSVVDEHTIRLHTTSTPARDLPNALWLDVCIVLEAHGLHASPADVMVAVAGLIDRTPVDRGGRLEHEETTP